MKEPQNIKDNFISKEIKIYNANGELLAMSSSHIPLEEGECNICRAENELREKQHHIKRGDHNE